MDYETVKATRRRLEDQIRQDCARLEKLGAQPGEIAQALEGVIGFWWGELQDIEIPFTK
jgi:hypothetical protein